MADPTNEPILKSPVAKSGWMSKVGVGLILLSGVFFFSMFAVPWVPISAGQKVFLAGALFVAVQVAWWSGAALAGPAVIGVFRSWFQRPTKREP